MKEASSDLLNKSLRSIEAAEKLSPSDPDFAISRAYYSMFYVAEALLYEKNLRFRKHSAVHAAFGEYFAKTGIFDSKYHRWFIRAFEKRITSDYEVEATLSTQEALETIQQAREFLEAARQYLLQPRKNEETP